MWTKLAVGIVVAMAGGAVAGTATSDSDAGVMVRAKVAAVFAPAATAMAWWRDRASFYGHDDATSSPTSILDNFAKPDSPDPDFLACVSGLGPDPQRSLQDLAERHSHHATAGLVGCLLSRNPQRFCTPLGRRQAADAMELYYWSRATGVHPTHERLMAEKMDHLEDDTALAPAKDDVDPYKRTWDGPEDQAVVEGLKSLVRAGYLDADAFGYFPRPEIREALRGVKPSRAACANAQAG